MNSKTPLEGNQLVVENIKDGDRSIPFIEGNSNTVHEGDHYQKQLTTYFSKLISNGFLYAMKYGPSQYGFLLCNGFFHSVTISFNMPGFGQ